jgi:outer membrane protein TolC
MRLLLTTIIILFIFLTSITATAEPLDNILTLDMAIERAIANNNLIKEAIEKQRAAVQEHKSASADMLPKLSASYSYTRLKDAPYAVFGPSRVTISDRDNFHWDITVTQPIFTGFALSTKKKIAELGVKIGEIEKEQAILDVIKEVKTAYFNILLAGKFLMVAREAVKQLEAHVKDAENFYREGLIAYNDLLKSKVALASATQEKVKAESNLEMAISSLNTLLGLDINHKTRVEDILKPVPLTYDLDRLMEMALNERPELKTLRLTLKNADYAIKLAKSSYYPEIVLVGSYEQNGDDFLATNNDYRNAHNASITLQARLTLFDWGRTNAEVKRYYHEKMSLVQKIKGIEDSVKLEVKNAFLNLRVAEQNIQTARESLSQAKENFRITELQYRNQIATSTDVVDARTSLTEAETNYYKAIYGYLISIAELERATGMYPLSNTTLSEDLK